MCRRSVRNETGENTENRVAQIRAGRSQWLMLLVLVEAALGIFFHNPDHLRMGEKTMDIRSLWWTIALVIAIALIAGIRWVSAAMDVHSIKAIPEVKAQQTQSHQARREYVLEVIGMGVTLDKFRQGALWKVLTEGDAHTTIREQDKEKYPWSEMERSGITGGRAGDTLENGAKHTPMYWGVPSFYAACPSLNPAEQGSASDPIGGLAAGARSSGMASHLFATGPWQLAEYPDRLLEQVFAFFDGHPDIPYVVVGADDDMYARDMGRAPGTPRLLKDGHYIPEMPDSSALFVLARRERVDALRPFAWEDPQNDFVQNQLRWMYYDLMQAVAQPRRETPAHAPAEIGAYAGHDDKYQSVAQRQPTVEEWLEAAAAFAQRPDVRGVGLSGAFDDFNPWAHRPPREWKPTPWFPIPWNKDQLATFDRLPTLGYIHRPVFVKFTDEDGHALTRREQRQQALRTGWQQALQTLPEAERVNGPVRVITGNGGKVEQTIILHNVLNEYATQGGAELTSKPGALIDTDLRLGNTGAATLFVQMGIGVMGSYREGGVSAAINLRDHNEASIVMISPPSDEQRQKQLHSKGGDVFGSHITPAIDPANYGM
jgi:hypothetical protein